jgi:acetyltransferase-like isoleucine patch superfamily enzyme
MHDNVIGNFTTIAPNAVLLGYVTTGECAYLGANSTILPNTKIGTEAIVGAGAVVTRDVPRSTIVKGVPAK